MRHLRGKRENRDVLRRYTASFVLLIVLPFILLDITFLYNGLKQVESTYVTSQEYALKQAIQNIDKDLEAWQMVSVQIATDPDITPYKLRTNRHDTMTALKKLQSYRAQLGFLDAMYLYIAGGEELYSGTGITSLENFCGNSYYFSEEGGEEAFRAYIAEGKSFALSLNGNGGILTRPNGAREYVAITYPWVQME